MKEKDYIYVIKIVHRVLLLFVIKLSHVVNHSILPPPGKKQQNKEIYNKIHQYLVSERHFLDKNIDIKIVASKLKVNKVQVNKELRARYNKTFYKYINKLRVEYSYELLLDPQNKLVEVIASECRFNNLRTFERNFKELNNMTPSEYRRIYQEAKNR